MLPPRLFPVAGEWGVGGRSEGGGGGGEIASPTAVPSGRCGRGKGGRGEGESGRSCRLPEGQGGGSYGEEVGAGGRRGGRRGLPAVQTGGAPWAGLRVGGVPNSLNCFRVSRRPYPPHLTDLLHYQVFPVSQAGAGQRAGRADRTGPGIAYRLYTESERVPPGVNSCYPALGQHWRPRTCRVTGRKLIGL